MDCRECSKYKNSVCPHCCSPEEFLDTLQFMLSMHDPEIEVVGGKLYLEVEGQQHNVEKLETMLRLLADMAV